MDNITEQLELAKKKINDMYNSLPEEQKKDCKKQVDDSILKLDESINEIKKALKNAN